MRRKRLLSPVSVNEIKSTKNKENDNETSNIALL